MQRLATSLMFVLIVAGAAFVSGAMWRLGGNAGPASITPDLSSAVEFLRREPLSFLVTERVVTQVVVEVKSGNLVTGYGSGVLVGKVELLYGVDLDEAALDEAAYRDGVLHVPVPAPKLLRYVPDLESLRFIEKKTALLTLVDAARDVDLFHLALAQLEHAASEFAEENDLAPTREQLLSRLNRYAPVIAAQTGVQVVFE